VDVEGQEASDVAQPTDDEDCWFLDHGACRLLRRRGSFEEVGGVLKWDERKAVKGERVAAQCKKDRGMRITYKGLYGIR